MINKESNFSSFVTSVRQTGVNESLVDGELMVVTTQNPTARGLRHATNLNVPKNQKYFKIEVGADKRVNSRSYVYGDSSTQFFALEDIKEVRVARPVSNEVEVDEWIIGYNGGNDLSTGLDFKSSDKNFTIVLELDGGSIPWRGGDTNVERVVISEPVGELLPYNSCLVGDDCAPLPCKEITENLIERLRERQAGGGYKLKEVADITPIYSCDRVVGTDEFTFYTLENCDLGDAQSLAIIQSQTTTPVVRIARRGSVSIYQTFVPTGSAPADVEITFRSIMADCDSCPEDYTLVAGGYIYSFTINDNGTPTSPTIPTAVGGTLKRQGGSDNIGTYTVKTTALLNATQLTALQTSYPTMRIDLVGEAVAICAPDAAPIEIAWIEGETCQASTKQFTIDLKDTNCGYDRLAELQAAYPDYVVSLSPNSTTTSYAITLTGTSGTANINIAGVDYLASYATSLTATATAFVTANATALSALGITVTSTGAVITVVAPTSAGAPTVVNATTDLAGTVVAGTVTPAGAGCRNQYLIDVPTNFTCEECSDVFRDIYTAERPHPFMDVEWKEVVESAPATDCACGIRIRGKVFTLDPERCLDGKVPFIEDSIGIKVAAGFSVAGYEGYIDTLIAGQDFKEVSVVQQSRKKGRDMLAGNLKKRESEGSVYFQGFPKEHNNLRRALLGRESVMQDNFTQMVEYQIVMNPSKYTQGFGHTDNGNDLTYSYLIPLGDEAKLETELFRLAAAANAPIVQAN